MLSYVLVQLSRYTISKNIIILVSSILVVFLLAFRLFFAFFYIIKYYITRRCKNFSDDWVNTNRKHGIRVYEALRAIEEKTKEVEKEKTKRKKMEEFKNLTSATSIILSKALSNFGKKIRNKVARHIVQNNIVPKKDIMDPFKKRLMNTNSSKKLSSFRKKEKEN
jgi:hypothetical protein